MKITILNKFLAWFGLPFCRFCGYRLFVVGTRSYYDRKVYECPECHARIV